MAQKNYIFWKSNPGEYGGQKAFGMGPIKSGIKSAAGRYLQLIFTIIFKSSIQLYILYVPRTNFVQFIPCQMGCPSWENDVMETDVGGIPIERSKREARTVMLLMLYLEIWNEWKQSWWDASLIYKTCTDLLILTFYPTLFLECISLGTLSKLLGHVLCNLSCIFKTINNFT